MSCKKVNWFKHMDFVLLDFVCIEAAYLLSIFLHFGHWEVHVEWSMYWNVNIFFIVTDLVFDAVTKPHQDIVRRGYAKELAASVKKNLAVWLSVIVYLFLVQQGEDFSRTIYLLGFVLSTLFVWIVRSVWKYFLRKKLSNTSALPRLLLVTIGSRVDEVTAKLQSARYSGYSFIGAAVVEENNKETKASNTENTNTTTQEKTTETTQENKASNAEEKNKRDGVVDGRDGKSVCTPDNLSNYLLSNVVDDVYVSLPNDHKQKRCIIDMAVRSGAKVHVELDSLYKDIPNYYMDDIASQLVVSGWVSTATPLELMAKRVLDILGGLVGCLLTGIAYLFVAPAIKKASPGPAFFTQERVGQNGRRFKMYKFRSMYLDAEERKKELMAQNEVAGGLMFKIKNDPRIIGGENGIGNFIRKTSVDELPQFWNILKGDMSLVGTRPPTVGEVEQYDLHHKIRLSMKPGLTGMWQVSGRSDIKDFEEVVRLDEEYISNWNLWLDIKILWKTVLVVVLGRGAE